LDKEWIKVVSPATVRYGSAEESPATVTTAPHETLVGRIDEARAARQPDLRWRKKD
jgi:hypothetical protein